MKRRSTPPLRVAPPTLEPDSVLLHQLAQLSASSAPAARTVRHAGARAFAVAATVAVIGGTTWAAGALSGPEVPPGPADQPAQSATGTPTTGGEVVRTPQPDDRVSSAPGSPTSPGLPGDQASAEVLEEPDAQPQPPREGPGMGDGDGNGHGRGNATGHVRNPDNGPAEDHPGQGPRDDAPGQGPRDDNPGRGPRDDGRDDDPGRDGDKRDDDPRWGEQDPWDDRDDDRSADLPRGDAGPDRAAPGRH